MIPKLKTLSRNLFVALFPLAWATTAHAVPIPSDLLIDAEIDFALGVPDPFNGTQDSAISLISGGVATSATSDGVSVTSGAAPIVDSLIDIGDGVSGSSAITGASTAFEVADVLAFLDFFIDIENTSLAKSFLLTFDVIHELIVSADGPDALSDAEVFVDNVTEGTTPFEELVEVDTFLGTDDPDIPSTTDSFGVFVGPGALVSLSGSIITTGLAFDGSFDSSVSGSVLLAAVDDVTAVPEPGPLTLMAAGLGLLLVYRRRAARV